VEIGGGVRSAELLGSQNNDEMNKEGFLSHHAGGTLGGISSGDTLDIKVYFKPTPSIFKLLKTLDIHGKVLADMVLLNMGRKMDDVARYYGKGRV